MPVLFVEISADLNLSLTQIGTAWGMLGLSGVIISVYGGILGDKFGPKRVLAVLCLLGGITGAMRGLSFNFITLAAAMFAFGFVRAMIPITVHKAARLWFDGPNLSIANSIVSMAMGFGLTLGPLVSATVLSPLLGSWRQVLLVYGTMSVAIGLLWTLQRGNIVRGGEAARKPTSISMRAAISQLVRTKVLWLIGLALMFRTASIIGFVGYLPLYLRGQGWDTAHADGALAGFYAISTLSVIPISLLSNKLHSRKYLLFAAAIIAVLGIGFLPLASGIAIWLFVLAVGITMDAYMSITITFTQERQELSMAHSGTALGIIFTLSQLGAFVSPPIGNSLSQYQAGLPFAFWAFMSLCNIIILVLLREKRKRV
jgi:cyanate permease